jgi:hypothetical protein
MIEERSCPAGSCSRVNGKAPALGLTQYGFSLGGPVRVPKTIKSQRQNVLLFSPPSIWKRSERPARIGNLGADRRAEAGRISTTFDASTRRNGFTRAGTGTGTSRIASRTRSQGRPTFRLPEDQQRNSDRFGHRAFQQRDIIPRGSCFITARRNGPGPSAYRRSRPGVMDFSRRIPTSWSRRTSSAPSLISRCCTAAIPIKRVDFA